MSIVIMEGVSEYAEGRDVKLDDNIVKGSITIEARNEAGFNGTSVDLLGVLEWVSVNRPDLYKRYVR